MSVYLIYSDGTLNKTPLVPNSLDANHELGKTESSQQPVLYMTSDIGNMKPPHPSGPQNVRYYSMIIVISIHTFVCYT